MPTRDIKTGDTVRLKSGGPTMSVQLVADDRTMAYCTWFEGEALRTGAFAMVTLERAEPPAANTSPPPM